MIQDMDAGYDERFDGTPGVTGGTAEPFRHEAAYPAGCHSQTRPRSR
jgi:hypothetical protein